MMSPILKRILSDRIIAVVRTENAECLPEVVAALSNGGISIIEVTLTIPNALDAIHRLCESFSNQILIGAGTILDSQTAEKAIEAGAKFVVSPIVNLDVIRTCRDLNSPVMPGAYTPTEIVTAWNAGADVVKVFPADSLGPAFFRAMKGPLPHIRLMPTGGVNLQTANEFLDAGASCLGIGGKLVDPIAIREKNFKQLTETAKQYRSKIPLLGNS